MSLLSGLAVGHSCLGPAPSPYPAEMCYIHGPCERIVSLGSGAHRLTRGIKKMGWFVQETGLCRGVTRTLLDDDTNA